MHLRKRMQSNAESAAIMSAAKEREMVGYPLF
jgi:hypothetical protein